MLVLGKTSQKKNVYFWALPESGGGEALARNFWPSFHQVLIPKISQYLLKSLHTSMSYAQYVVFDVREKRTKLPELGGGGRRANLDNARK